MKIVKVTYTTSLAFSVQNQQNIQSVMADLKMLNYSGINYNCCLCADNQTFIHTAFFKTEEDQKLLNDLSSFQEFQQQLKASLPEVPPKQDLLSLVGSSYEIFS